MKPTPRTVVRLICSVFLIAFANSALRAQSNAIILRVVGAVEQPLALTRAQFQKLPHHQLIVGGNEGESSHYDGVQLADLIKQAKPILSEKCCSNTVNTVVIVNAADQYQAIFALPELNEKFNAQQILLADQHDDKPIDAAHGPLQLIVPGEKVHARWVRQVTTIQIVPLGNYPAEGRTNSSPR